MLVVLRGDLRGDDNLVGVVDRLIRGQGVGVDDTGGLDLELDRAVESKVEVEAILVVGNGADRGDDELSVPRNVGLLVSEISVLVQDSGVFLAARVRSSSCADQGDNSLNADGALDVLDATGSGDKVGVEIGDTAETVAAKGQAVGEGTDTVLAGVKCLLSVVGEGGLGVLPVSMS